MVFLSRPPSLNSYESTREPTRPRLASFSGLSPSSLFADNVGVSGESGVNVLWLSVMGVLVLEVGVE